MAEPAALAWRTSLVAGAVAGMSAELVLFPVDSLKTRVQSSVGLANFGLRGAYRGVAPAMLGAGPSSAIFFCAYERTKHALKEEDASMSRQCGALVAASVAGELAACSVRVPADLMKQRLQVGSARSFAEALRSMRNTPARVVLAALQATAARDVGHSSLQFPLYECLKVAAASALGRSSAAELPAGQAAACGSLAGALSAVVTTPLDVIKTRLNLRTTEVGAHAKSSLVTEELARVYRSAGLRGFFAGASMRAAWMAGGGFVFLGTFELARECLSSEWRLPAAAALPSPSSMVSAECLSGAAA